MKRALFTTIFLIGFSLVFSAGCAKTAQTSPTTSTAQTPTVSTQPSAQLTNPWTNVQTTEEAAKAAGLDSFNAPEKIGDYRRATLSVISGEEGIAQAVYQNDNDTLTLRKGHGTKDISGDYRDLGEWKTFEIAGSGTQASMMIDNNHNVYICYWGENGIMYSLSSEKGIQEADLSQILKMIYSI